MANKPACARTCESWTCRDERADSLHEASASGDHDVLDIREGLELGAARENGRLLPNAIVFEEAWPSTVGVAITICAYCLCVSAVQLGKTRVETLFTI